MEEKNYISIGLVFWASILSSIVFTWSDAMFDGRVIAKWIAMAVSVIAIISFNAISVFVMKHTRLRLFSDMKNMLTAISFVLSVLSIYGIIQYFNYTIPGAVIGSYDNPAGFAATLSCGLPFIMLGMALKDRALRKLHIIAFALSAIAILISGSRAGMICLALVFLLGGYKFTTKRHWLKWILILIWLFILAVQMFVKTDSAAGRILIWTCSLKMMKGHWLFGYGPGGFKSHYMDFQADYLASHPDSPYAMLADTVQYPFNEYLNIMTDYGLAGLSLVLLFIGYMVFRYFKNRTAERLTALLGILSVAVFALFSYPLMYSFVWFILIYGSAVLLSDIRLPFRFTTVAKRLTACVALAGCVYFGYRLYVWTQAEIQWKQISDKSVFDDITISEYERIYDTLYNDRYFLYNYSYALYRAAHYERSHKVASECRELWADYDLELLLGMVSEKLGKATEAISHYSLASDMCPNRLRPLYLLMKLYDGYGMPDKALCYAMMLCDKPVKIPSGETARIKKELKII